MLITFFSGVSAYAIYRVDDLQRTTVTIKQYDRDYGGICQRLDNIQNSQVNILLELRTGKGKAINDRKY